MLIKEIRFNKSEETDKSMSRQLLKQEHFKNLSKYCYTNDVSSDIQEYFQFLKNSNIENSDKNLFKNHKKNLNDLNSNEIRKENETAFINKNQYHCEFCKISYFQNKNKNNVKISIKPKCYISLQNAKLLSKYKLNKQNFKYNSYKQRLVKRLIKTSHQLYYKCKRCKSNNLIYKEKERCNLDKLKLVTKKTESVKNRYDLLIIKSKLLNKTTSNVETTTTSGGSKKQKNFYRNIKFQSLKLAAAAEVDNKKKLADSNKFCLNDFLEKIK